MIIAILWIVSLVIMYFVGRNNPSIGVVNKLLAAKKVIIDAAGTISKAVK
jgi:hypothetical protein